MSLDHEVIIVGAGPAGCAAALRLAQEGRRVLLVDRADFPREKVCGEGLMPHGLAALATLGIQVAGKSFCGIRYVAGDRLAEGRFPSGRLGAGVRRYALDKQLLECCAERPEIEVRLGQAVRGLRRHVDRVEVLFSDQVCTAAAVVGADGLHSQVRRWVGLQRPSRGRLRYGLRRHYRLATATAGDWVEVHLADGMELYLTPTGASEINLAVLLEKEGMKGLKGRPEAGFDAWVDRCPAMRERLAGAVPITPVRVTGPLRQHPSALVSDRVVLVGDAAGFVDAITGEGMSLGILGAILAAEVLHDALERGRLDASALSAYPRRFRRRKRDLVAITEIVLWGIRRRWLTHRVLDNLARNPDLFTQVLAVNIDQAPLSSLGFRGVRRLLVGR